MCKEVRAFKLVRILFKSFLIVLDLPMGASGGAMFSLSPTHRCRQKNGKLSKDKTDAVLISIKI